MGGTALGLMVLAGFTSCSISDKARLPAGLAGGLLKALHRREAQRTTGLLDVFAIPHGEDIKIKAAIVVYLRNMRGID